MAKGLAKVPTGAGWLEGEADRQVPAIGAPRNSGLRQMPALHGAAVCCGPPGSPAANPLRLQPLLPSPKPSSQPPAPAAAPAACSSLGSPPGARQRASSSHGGHLEWRSGGTGRRAGRQPKGSPLRSPMIVVPMIVVRRVEGPNMAGQSLASFLEGLQQLARCLEQLPFAVALSAPPLTRSAHRNNTALE